MFLTLQWINVEETNMEEPEGEQDCEGVVYQCGACDEQFATLEEIEKHHSGEGGSICPYMVTAAIEPTVEDGKSEVVVIAEEVAFSEDVDDPETLVIKPSGNACTLCGKTFTSALLLEAHLQSHKSVEAKVHDCDLCKQRFNDTTEYMQHLVSKHAKKDHCCMICNKWYTSRSNLKTHMMIHAGNKPHECDICGRQFTVSSNLKAHRRIHTGERKYVCTVCSKGFITSTHLKTHMSVHTGDKPYQCEICFREFAVNSNMKAHMLTHTGEKRHECKVCGKQFATSSHVKTHLLSHTGQKDHKCPTCGKCFTVASNLRAHIKIHLGQRDHACDLCDKRFYTNSDLRSHRMIHTGERPYQCEVCSERFTKMSNLNSHRATHTGERPHQCKICQKRFRKMVNLRAHLKSHEMDRAHPCALCDQAFPNVTRLRVHTKECHRECHVCSDCGKKFNSFSALEAHQKVHTDAFPYECHVCQRTFTKLVHLTKHYEGHVMKKNQCPLCELQCSSDHQLTIHMRTHTGERPYSCEVCSSKFTKLVNLKRHLQVHTKVRFECQVCLRCFISDASLQSHYATAHPGYVPDTPTNELHIVVKQELVDAVEDEDGSNQEYIAIIHDGSIMVGQDLDAEGCSTGIPEGAVVVQEEGS